MNTDTTKEIEVKEDAKPKGWANEKQIEAWKKEHKCRSIKSIITPDEGDGTEHITYFAPSTMTHLDVLKTYSKDGDELGGLKLLFNSLRIGGSEDVLEYVDLLKSAILGSSKIHKAAQSTLGKQ